ncbi:MAG: MBL fold metallo-hydrolase, partial [Rhizobiaceae bacterium]
MHIRIIGSAAGGGFPQWNCNFRLSRAARKGTAGIRARTQSSLAVSADGKDWVLFNASPDIRQQIAETPALHPPESGPLRASPIKAIVLTNADVDHIAGLLSLRERQAFALYGTERVLSVLAENPVFEVLDRRIVPRRALRADTVTDIADAGNEPTGVRIEAFDVPGKIALYLENQVTGEADYRSDAGDTIGIRLVAGEGGSSFFYVPA